MDNFIIDAFERAGWVKPNCWVTYTAITRAVNQITHCRGSVIERRVRALVEKGIFLRYYNADNKPMFSANLDHQYWRYGK